MTTREWSERARRTMGAAEAAAFAREYAYDGAELARRERVLDAAIARRARREAAGAAFATRAVEAWRAWRERRAGV